MAEYQSPQQQLQQQQQVYQRPTDAIRSILPEKGLSSTQVLAVVTLLPISGFLLFLAGITLTGTLIGLAVSTPLFIIFSPILVPAALVIVLAVTGFMTSGAFGITALSSLSWIANNMRSLWPAGQVEQAKRRVRETAGQEEQKTREVGQTQSKAQDEGRSGERETAQEEERAQEEGRSEEGEKAQEDEKT